MSRLTRDGTAEPVSRDQILRHARGQGNVHFPCSADHEQDWQPYPVDPYSAIRDDHTFNSRGSLDIGWAMVDHRKRGAFFGSVCVRKPIPAWFSHRFLWYSSTTGVL